MVPNRLADGRESARRRARLTRLLILVAVGAAAVWPRQSALRGDAPGTALPPASAGGIERLDPLLRKLATNRRLLIIAAHPDDEDSPLLTLVSRGMGGEAAYLSLSRGDGGQNLIGDELGEALGVIRTEELNAARRLDGARQYFTRAFDFGFSKSIEETFRFWPKEVLLEDTVRIIRRFRPQVIVAIFSGTPRDGHGQHQASGIVAREAFHIAGDPNAYRELARESLPPWRPSALYQTTRFLDRDKTTMILATGSLEPLTGRSFQQIGVASRSLQRSQGTGALQPIGPNEARLGWLEGGAGKDAKDPFDGIDTRLASLAAGGADDAKRKSMEISLARAEALAKETRQRIRPTDLSVARAPLASILEALRSARLLASPDSPSGAAAATILDEKISIAETALACASGLAIDALADTETATEGETIPVTVQIWNAGGEAVEVEAAGLESSAGWTAAPAASGKPVAAGALAEWKLSASLPAHALPTVPYYLAKPLRGALYDWSAAPASVRGEPSAPPPLIAAATVKISDSRIRLTREVTFRFRDEAYGEVRHPVRAVPKVEISVSPDLIVWSTARASGPAAASVTLVSNARDPLAGRVRARPTEAWSAPPQPFSLGKKGDRAVLDVALSPTRSMKGGRFEIPVIAELSTGETCGEAIRLIDYEHIRPAPFPKSSTLSLTAVDLKLPALRSVGYVRGAADRVPESLLAVGVPIHLLSGAELERVDLSRFDAIVVGGRAYETEPALAAANERLLRYVRSGGLLIVQYQQYGFIQGGFAPEKLEIARPHDRVTDETAPVTILSPAHPIFTTPNRIGPADWEGWLQERGLYFARSWAPAYTPLLAMADPGGPEQKGSLLVATIGRGHYVYTGLAFFRELPAGVPGAYRLFANLLAWRAAP